MTAAPMTAPVLRPAIRPINAPTTAPLMSAWARYRMLATVTDCSLYVAAMSPV